MSREMKDSGIDYVGDMPFSWKVIPNKYVMKKKKDICDKWNNENVLSLTMNGVIIRDLINPVGKMPTTFDGYQYVYPNDLLMCLFDIDVTPRCIGIVKNFGVTSPAYSRFTLYDGYCTKYYYYYYLYLDNKKELLHLAKNLRHSFTEEELGYLKTPVPPLSEQQKIADFLDEKVKEIDNAIEKTKETIELYKKYKQAIITEAVTKGLDPNAEMKDSGIEWIGKVPKSWKLVKSKYVVTITHGSDPMTSGKIPVYGSGGKSFRTCGEFKDGPCVLIGRKGTINIPHYIIGKYWNIDTAFDVKTLTTDIELKYYYYLATCFDYNSFITNTTLPSMTQADYNSMIIPLPSRKIQMKIIDWLDKKCDYIDKIIEQENYLILMTENYKKSLIYEYVTGKKEVK